MCIRDMSVQVIFSLEFCWAVWTNMLALRGVTRCYVFLQQFILDKVLRTLWALKSPLGFMGQPMIPITRIRERFAAVFALNTGVQVRLEMLVQVGFCLEIFATHLAWMGTLITVFVPVMFFHL